MDYLRFIFLSLFAMAASAFAQSQPAPRQAAMDDNLRAAFLNAQHQVRPINHGASGGYHSAMPENQLAAEFAANGAVTTQHPEGSFQFRLAGYGYGKQLQTPTTPSIHTAGTRVEYRRGALTEWYVSDSRGLEQGFTLRERPRQANNGTPLTFELAVTGGLRPVLVGNQIELRRQDNGSSVLLYTGLQSWDSNGQVLESHMSLRDGRVRLEVADQHAVYPVTVDPWIQQQQLYVIGQPQGDEFGNAVAVDGDTAIIGADNVFTFFFGTNTGGSAYIFTRSGGAWTLQQEIVPIGSGRDDGFGDSVSVSGNTVVVGGGHTRHGAPDTYVTIFTRSGTTWTQQQQFSIGGSDAFGRSVSVKGDTLVIGSPGWNGNRGAAYLYTRSGTTWTRQASLTASDVSPNSNFGYSVALGADQATVLIGAYSNQGQGSAYVFTGSGAAWTQQQQLNALDAAASDQFGVSVSLSADTALIGANNKNSGQGAAYVFLRSGSVWTQQQKLTASDAANFDYFGTSVAVDADTAVIGAENKNSQTGSAYAFSRSGTTWTQSQILQACNVAPGMAFPPLFGAAVSVSGGTAIVGAPVVQDNSKKVSPGNAYAFLLSANAVPVSINTSPSGLAFTLSGPGCVGNQALSAPQTQQWVPGDSWTVTFATPQNATTAGTRYAFTGWADGSSANGRVITAPSTATSYTANFKTQYQLTTAVSPAGSGTVTGAGYYDSGALANIGATPAAGYQFANWTGAVASSSSASTTATLTGPTTVTAVFAQVTTTTVAPATGLPGATVTLSATITPSAAAFAGSLQFQIAAVNAGPAIPVTGGGTYTTNYLITNPSGTYAITATLTPAANSGFTASSGANTLTVQATQTITFPQPADTLFSAGSLTLSATASSGLTVSFSSNSTPVCTVSGAKVTFVTTGQCSITASQAGNTTYAAATSVSRAFLIGLSPAITLQPSNAAVTPGQTASFSAAAGGTPPPTVKWQSSTDGVNFADIANATSTTYSFTAQLTDNGKYFRALFTNLFGTVTTIAAMLTAGPVSFVGTDNTGQGTWTGKYGADGYIIAGGAIHLPSYATVTIGKNFAFPPAATAQTFQWAGLTTDVRALQNGPGATNRIAATYTAPDYSNNFQVKINTTDNNRHQIALYLLDWDSTIRTETILLADSTNAVLDTQSLSSFSNGKYAVWSFQGSLTLTITGNTGGPVLSGLFFDPVGGGNTPQPSFTLSATSATATAGSTGSSTVSVTPANGFNSAVTLAAAAWPAGITGVFGTNPTTTGSSGVTISVASNVAAGPYSLTVTGTSGSLSANTTIPLTVSAVTPPPLALSATGATIAAGSSGTTTLTETPTPANNIFDLTLNTAGWPAGITPGTQSNFTLGINVASTVTPGFYSLPLTGTKAALSASTAIALTVTGPTTTTASATYTGLDSTTEGTWTGKFGADGYVIANGNNSPPSYAGVILTGLNAYTWASQTTDARSPQRSPGSATGIASSFYGSSFNIGVNLTDGNTHQVALYLLDFDTTNRTETIQVLDAATLGVLNTQSFTGFNTGQYASWNVKGNVIFKVTSTGGINAVVSGIFFAPATGAPPPPTPSFTLTATAASVAVGSTGTSTLLVVPANGFNSSVTLATSSWPAGITGVFVPNPAPNTSILTITVGANVTPGPYSLTVNGTSGSLSSSTTVALNVTAGSGSSSSANFVGTPDTTTGGAWIGKYGAKGYFIANGPSSPPLPVIASIVGAFTFTWSGQTTDPHALQIPGSTTGFAAAYTQYPNSSFTIPINTSDFNIHSVSLYLLDWDSTTRSETITVYDAVTNAVLDTQTFTGFHNGEYVSLNIKGSVIIKVTPNGSSSPVVSGVFFN